MKTDQDATTARSMARTTGRLSAAPGVADWVDGRQARAALVALPDRAPRFIARAPGRFDIMGGFTDYSGGSVLFTPTAARAYVALQQRDDDKLLILQPGDLKKQRKEPTVMSLGELCGPGQEPIPAEQARELIGDDECGIIRSVTGAILEAIRARLIPRPPGGFTVAVVSSDAEPGNHNDATQSKTFVSLDHVHTTISGATLAALATALDCQPEPQSAMAVCQTVENQWFGLPVGGSDADCVWRSEPEMWHEVQYVPFAPGNSLLPPDSFELVGLYCGSFHPDAVEKFTEARVAAFMGRLLIDKIIAHEGAGNIPWDGYLSRVDVESFADRFRERIPTRLKGRDFLDRFGETGDPLTRIHPDTTYKIRSRTEHHVHEHARSRQFLTALARINGTQTRDGKDARSPSATPVLTELGEIMYASHWSYGQRCGLGCIEADRLVKLIRQRGPDQGLFGARITGRGCGGMVAVLMDTSDQAHSALGAVIDEYQELSGKTITVHRGSAAGAMSGGVRRV